MLRLSAGSQRLSGSKFQVARNSKTATTEIVQAITRNDQLSLTGGPQMLMTSNVGGWCADVHQARRSRSWRKRYINMCSCTVKHTRFALVRTWRRWRFGRGSFPWWLLSRHRFIGLVNHQILQINHIKCAKVNILRTNLKLCSYVSSNKLEWFCYSMLIN